MSTKSGPVPDDATPKERSDRVRKVKEIVKKNGKVKFKLIIKIIKE